MELRPASEADFEAQHAVLDAAEGGLRRRHRFDWTPPPFESFAAAHAHLLATDPDRSWVAEERGRVVAYAAAFVRGETWFLSDLFVHPDAQGRGVGPRLLERAWGDGPRHRITLADAIQPVSNAMYARRGLVPATPVLELGGEALSNSLLLERVRAGASARGLLRRAHAPAKPVEAVEPRSQALAALDAAAYGFDRAVDHAFWSRSARCTVWLREGRPAAYSYVSPSGRIGPVAGADAESAALALGAELAAREGAPTRLDIPGSSRELVETALAAGLRITGPPGLLLLSAGLAPPTALALHGYWLF